jgi:hypothetical protein
MSSSVVRLREFSELWRVAEGRSLGNVVSILVVLALFSSAWSADCQESLRNSRIAGSSLHSGSANTHENGGDPQGSPVPASPLQNPLLPRGSVSCNPTVTGRPTEVVTARKRKAVTNSVLPEGVVGPTGFDWPDTPLGMVKSLDGVHSLFFGSDGSCHANCNLPDERDGSITRTEGTLDNPLGSSPPRENVLPIDTLNLPPYMLYAGGGSVYRVPPGSPGAGDLFLVYQAARASFEPGYHYPDCDSDHKNCYQHQNGFYSYLGLANSKDDGKTWRDLGLIIAPATPYNPQLTWDIGSGNLVVKPGSKYLYIYFPDLIDNEQIDTCLSLARASYDELLRAAASGSPIPAFKKYNNGEWNQPGLGGQSSSVFSQGPYCGDNTVLWNSATQQFTAILDDNLHVSMSESPDGLHWSPSVLLFQYDAADGNAQYATAVSAGADPDVLGSRFYVYYTHYPTNGTGWDDATVNRFEVQCNLPTETLPVEEVP